MEHINASRHKQTNCLAISCPEGGLFPPAHIHHWETVSTSASCLSQHVWGVEKMLLFSITAAHLVSPDRYWVCMCVHVCMRIHNFCIEDYTEQLLKVTSHRKWRTGDFIASTETTSRVLSLGILVHIKLPLTLHFCRCPRKKQDFFACSALLFICVQSHMDFFGIFVRWDFWCRKSCIQKGPVLICREQQTSVAHV